MPWQINGGQMTAEPDKRQESEGSCAECWHPKEAHFLGKLSCYCFISEKPKKLCRCLKYVEHVPAPTPAAGMVERWTDAEVRVRALRQPDETIAYILGLHAHIDTLAAENERLKAKFERLADVAHELYRAALGEDTGVLGAPSWSVAAAKLYLVLEEKNVQA